jgi:hypothetical protein
MISKANQARIKRFLARHRQHEVHIKFLGEERDNGIKIHLGFHNGENWMGLDWECKVEALNETLRDAFKSAMRFRPYLLKGVYP